MAEAILSLGECSVWKNLERWEFEEERHTSAHTTVKTRGQPCNIRCTEQSRAPAI